MQESPTGPGTAATALAVAAGVWVLLAAWQVITWIIIAVLFAVALTPAVDALERRGLSNGVAVPAVCLAAVAVVGLIAWALVPPLIRQTTELIQANPAALDDLTRGRGPLGFLQSDYGLVDRAREALKGQSGSSVLGLTSPALGVLRGILTAVVATVAVLDLIPLMGATLGTFLVAAVALGQGLVPCLVVLAVLIVYQQLENHLLQPVIYRRTVQLSPLMVLIAVLLGGQIAGIIGALPPRRRVDPGGAGRAHQRASGQGTSPLGRGHGLKTGPRALPLRRDALSRGMSSGRLDRRARLLLGAAACFALTLALAVYVGRATSPPAVDRDVAQWVHEHRIDALDPAWRAVALLGGSVGLGAVVLASCVLAWRRLDRRWVTFLLASYIGAEVLFWSLKAVVDRPRPPVSLRLATAGSQSFPSGHTTVATAVGASLLIAATQIAEPRLRRVAMVALIALPSSSGSTAWPSASTGSPTSSEVSCWVSAGCSSARPS